MQNAGVLARFIEVTRSPVFGEAICRVPKLIFPRGGVCGTIALLAGRPRLAGGMARAGSRAGFVREFTPILCVS